MQNLFPSIAQTPWQSGRWPNFSAREIACKQGSCPYCGGEVWIDEASLDALQRMRDLLEAPLTINSGHRCTVHNHEIGGAKRSAHLELAFDIALENHTRADLFGAAHAAGFHHFGFMKFALHVDMREPAAAAAFWTYGPTSVALWRGIVPAGAADIGGD